MPKWISVEEAAAKYGINKEVIWLWADMKRFPMSYEKGITTVDEESLIGFLHQNKDRATAEYIDTLEDLCIGKTKICILYADDFQRCVQVQHRPGISSCKQWILSATKDLYTWS